MEVGGGGWGLLELKNTEERGGSSTSFGNPGGIRDKNIVPSIAGGGGGVGRKGCRFFWNNPSNQPRLLTNVTHLFTTTYWIIHHKLTHGSTKKNRFWKAKHIIKLTAYVIAHFLVSFSTFTTLLHFILLLHRAFKTRTQTWRRVVG